MGFISKKELKKMENAMKPGGTLPTQCGHYHPETVRICDVKIAGKAYRISWCDHCGWKARRIPMGLYSKKANSPEETVLYRKRRRKMAQLQKAGKLGSFVSIKKFESLVKE